MSAPSASDRRPIEVADAHRSARAAAATAAVLLVLEGMLSVVVGVDDHTDAWGAVSEVVAGLAFLSGAISLALYVPVSGWRAVLWWLAPAGLALSGLTMLSVPVVGAEPAEWLFVLAVLPCFIGTVSAGVLGIGRRWPWWVGAALAAFLPIMFLLPYNSFLMALVWMGVYFSTTRLES